MMMMMSELEMIDGDDDMLRCLDCEAGAAGCQPDLHARLHLRHH